VLKSHTFIHPRKQAKQKVFASTLNICILAATATDAAHTGANDMTTTNDIIATGGFNTGRQYTQHGQRIFWAQRADGWLFFNDLDRMVSGWVERTGPLVAAGKPVAPTWLMGKYDAGKFDFYAPNQTERNPSAPADFDYGAALRI
jgi:hypothetical protein